MAEKQIFDVVLEKHETMDATGITIPFDVEKVFGAKRVPVKVSINGANYRSTVVRMGGKYVMVVPKVFRDAASIKAGETITVTIEKDLEKRTVEVPKDFAEALQKKRFDRSFRQNEFHPSKRICESNCRSEKGRNAHEKNRKSD